METPKAGPNEAPTSPAEQKHPPAPDYDVLEQIEKGAPETPPDQGCRVPPEGWWCSREPGHDGPCAARPRASYDTVVLLLDRGEARGLVELLEKVARHSEKPMIVMDVARRLEHLLGEPRPYPRLPRR